MLSSIQGISPMQQMGRMQPHQPLSDDQKAQVKDILSQYDSSSLTATDAKSIFKSFEDAGIKGPGLRDAIKEAGYDPEQVWSLGHDGQKPPQGGPPPAGNNSKINSSALQSLQQILDQFDLSNLSDNDQTSLVSKLSDAGLLSSGSMIDLTA
jgi:hypothetical protein